MNKPYQALTIKIFFLIILTDIVESVAELFFKKGTLATGITNVTLCNFFVFISKMLIVLNLWFGICLYILNFFLWIIVLSKIDLSVAYPIGSTTYIIVPLLSIIFLGERVSLIRWIGIVSIIIGIYFISKSTKMRPLKP